MKRYHVYATWHGYAIVKHLHPGLCVEPQFIAAFDYEDRATAEAVCRDLNRSVARG